jgi:hypothetical protein
MQIDVEYSTAIATDRSIATPDEDTPRINMFTLRAKNREETTKSIYKELDSGLEWCQSVCEKAAHQILREGTMEIEGLNRRFTEIIKAAEGMKQERESERELVVWLVVMMS